ncbi:MAG: insulinase family protein, partial [Pseudohongiella sp.]|nr:insulinase family protein [Pseudohongiella sp.]
MHFHSSSDSSHNVLARIKPLFWRRVGAALLLTPLLLACSPAEQAPGANGGSTAKSPAAEVNAGYKRLYPANPDDPLDAHIFELDNGLQVYLTANHEEPRFYAEIAVRAGSKHDPADATGLAHYLEHLLFKGNQTMGTLDYEAERPHLEQIQALYEQHFNETDPTRRAEIYAEINRVSQLASQY